MSNYLKKDVIIDLGITLFLILFPHFIPLPFYSYTLVCLLIIYIFLKRKSKTFRDIGLKKNGISLKTIFIGISSALLWMAFMRWGFAPIISALFTVPDYTEYDFIKNNISNLMITIVAAWLVGGFYEEIAFRGIIGSALEKYFKPLWVSVFISSMLFGIYHWQQGIFGIVAATLGGLYWSFIYLYFGRNLWNSILSHALFDTITLILIYLGLFGK